jgi:hypothetical protein
MNIRYNRIFGVIILALGAINAFLAIWLLLLGTVSAAIVPGVICLFIGYSYLTRSYFTIDQHEIVLPALLGPLKRTYPYKTDNDIKIEGNSLFVSQGEGWKKVPIARFLVNNEDWDALERRFKRS